MMLYGADKEVCAWVSYELFGHERCFTTDCVAIGIVKNNKLIAGVVYSNYTEAPDGTPISIETSIASIDKTWATKYSLRALFTYPFIQLGLKRIYTLCSAQERDVIMFNQRLGFTQEGYHPEAWPLGGDAISFGMLKSNCKWVK